MIEYLISSGVVYILQLTLHGSDPKHQCTILGILMIFDSI